MVTQARQAAESGSKSEVIEDLYGKYRWMVLKVSYEYVRDWEEAKDVAQEAFVKAYLAYEGFQGLCSPSTWITRIAINQALTRLAARGRERLQRLSYLHESDAGGGMGKPHDPDASMAAERLIARADPITRKVLIMAFRNGLKHAEIAATLGISRVAVTRRITRFRNLAQRRGEAWR